MSTYVVINEELYPVDTPDQIDTAQTALVNVGQYSARVYAGDPECPDSYWNGQTLYQPGWAHERTDKPPTEHR